MLFVAIVFAPLVMRTLVIPRNTNDAMTQASGRDEQKRAPPPSEIIGSAEHEARQFTSDQKWSVEVIGIGADHPAA